MPKSSKFLLLIILFFVSVFFGLAQNPPTITATGNQNYCPNTALNIVTSASITDPDVGDTSLDLITIQISEGYTEGSDILILSGIHPSISSNWSVAQGTLTLTGPATFTEFENAIENVLFQTTQAVFTEDKFFSINIGSANYLPSTGHYYFYVADFGISWSAAEAAAASQVFFGLQGYLATITTAEESQLAGEQSPGAGWIGASDEDTESTWQWVTGPEAGTVFWIGDFNGNPQNGAFNFWNTGEPNNFGGNEHYAHITDPSIGLPGSWNDLPINGDPDTSGPYHPKGYLVEFGGLPGDPVINLSASTSINTPRIIDANNVVFCENDAISITVTSNTDSVLWYDSPTSTTPIFDGFIFNPSINTTTSYWVTPVYTGCTSGEKTEITVTVNPEPTVNDITIIECENDITYDGSTLFFLNDEFSNIVVGDTTNLVIEFFSDSALINNINGDGFTNTSNLQTVYALVTNTVTGCANTASVVLEVSTAILNNAILLSCENEDINGLGNFNLLDASSQILLGLPQNTNLEFYASLEDASTQSNLLNTNFSNTVPYMQTIYVTGNANGVCFGVAEVQLSVNQAPDVLADSEVYYCLNEFPNTITLSSGVIGNSNNFSISWLTGETSDSIEVNETGIYSVTITNNTTSCSITRNVNVLASNTATIESVEVEDTNQINSVVVTVSGEGLYEYALDNVNGSYQESNIFTNVSAGLHTVFIKDVLNNCGIVAQEVSVIGYPSYFTPNGDTVNDSWNIKGLSKSFNSVFVVNIYDRFGKLLYSLKNKDDSWDGTYNGAKMPASDYWFTVFLDRGKNFTGHFTLKR